MSARYTPAPWSLHDTGEAFRPFAIYAGRRCIADVNSEDDAQVQPEDRANANLLLAAPDMAAALQVLLDYTGGWDVKDPTHPIFIARAALAKAVPS